jgi:hyperosmotically inducible periplasmic protein
MLKRVFGALVILTLIGGTPLVSLASDDTSLGTKVDDSLITTKVKTKLTADRVKNMVNVKVDTTDGVVHLQGMVPNQTDKDNAERLARSVKGVRAVKNDIGVAASPSASPSTK